MTAEGREPVRHDGVIAALGAPFPVKYGSDGTLAWTDEVAVTDVLITPWASAVDGNGHLLIAGGRIATSPALGVHPYIYRYTDI